MEVFFVLVKIMPDFEFSSLVKVLNLDKVIEPVLMNFYSLQNILQTSSKNQRKGKLIFIKYMVILPEIVSAKNN